MTPEQRLAVRFAAEAKLSVPVNVHAAAATLATVQFEALPVGIDGVLLRRHSTRPLIIVSTKVHEKRQRFTLAHELGHILISWHVGSVGCSPELGDSDDSEIERACEGEANRFASELLLPTQWLRDAVRGAGTFREIYGRLAAAEVSAEAMTIALGQSLPPGHVYAEADEAGTVVLGGKSPGTALPTPYPGYRLEASVYAKAQTHETVLVGQHTIHWWGYPREATLTVEAGALPDSKTLLKEIVRRRTPPARASTALQSANGVIGAANSQFPTGSVAELVAVFQQRFGLRADLADLVTDPDFATFLEARAHEIKGRKRDS